MKFACIKQYEIKLWEEALKIEKRKLIKISANVKNDPITNLINIQIEFNDLLKSGEDRLTEEFANKINNLSKREKRERKRSKGFSFSNELDREFEQKHLVDEITVMVSNLKYYQGRNKS